MMPCCECESARGGCCVSNFKDQRQEFLKRYSGFSFVSFGSVVVWGNGG